MTRALWKDGDILRPATRAEVIEVFAWIADRAQFSAKIRRAAAEKPLNEREAISPTDLAPTKEQTP